MGRKNNKSSDSDVNLNQRKKFAPSKTPEGRENQMIALAMELAEKQLREGTASSQLITEFVKRGSTKARLEKEILKEQKKLMKAKTEAIQSAQRVEELYTQALAAMKKYSGQNEEEEDDSGEDLP